MIKVYNKNRTFRLEALDGSFVIVKANSFAEIEDKFTGDITYKTAIACGDMEVYNTSKQADAVEAKAVKEVAEANKGKKGTK